MHDGESAKPAGAGTISGVASAYDSYKDNIKKYIFDGYVKAICNINLITFLFKYSHTSVWEVLEAMLSCSCAAVTM